MLTSIGFENYRGFQRYRVDNLSRVNLLVGTNGSGKTAILEGLYLLATRPRRRALGTIAFRRREVALLRSGPGNRADPLGEQYHAAVSHFFHGHRVADGAHFRLHCEPVRDLGCLRARVAAVGKSPAGPSVVDYSASAASAFVMYLESATRRSQEETPSVLLSEDGIIVKDLTYEREDAEDGARKPVQFVSPTSLEPESMHLMWDTVVLQRRETEVIQAMSVVEPRLRDIVFLSAAIEIDRMPGGIVVGLEDTKHRVPLGTLGDGFYRLLALSLSVIQSQSGLLLVDEIDTGLHYSIMGDVWRLLTEAARQWEVQVFATTHSLDCVRGLAWLCENHPELRGEVSLQKIEPRLGEAVALDADGIMLAVSQGMEVR